MFFPDSDQNDNLLTEENKTAELDELAKLGVPTSVERYIYETPRNPANEYTGDDIGKGDKTMKAQHKKT